MKRIRWVRVVLVLLLAFLFSAYGYGSWYFSDIILATPQTSLASKAALLAGVGRASVPADVGLPAPEDFQLMLPETTLAGWYFKNPGNAQCGVLLLHGRSQTRLEMLPYAPLFWERGCEIVMYDIRGHGESSGQYGTWGYYESQDALAVLAWFEDKANLDTDQIGMLGVSYGAATSILAGVHEPELAFIAADSAFASMRRLLGEQATNIYGDSMRIIFIGPALWLSGVRGDFRPDEVEPASAIREFEPQVFLLHAREDVITLPAHSEAIFENADKSKTVLHITDWGAQHAQSILVDLDAYQVLMDDFLGTHVPDFGE